MKTILLADDNRGVREFCREQLQEAGYRVVLACDGRDAISRLSKDRPDVVVLDLRMRGMGGLEAIEQIHRVAADMPVIFFSANNQDYRRDHRSSLATAYVEKSEDLSELKQSIGRALTTAHPAVASRSNLPQTAGAHTATHGSSPHDSNHFESPEEL